MKKNRRNKQARRNKSGKKKTFEGRLKPKINPLQLIGILTDIPKNRIWFSQLSNTTIGLFYNPGFNGDLGIAWEKGRMYYMGYYDMNTWLFHVNLPGKIEGTIMADNLTDMLGLFKKKYEMPSDVDLGIDISDLGGEHF